MSKGKLPKWVEKSSKATKELYYLWCATNIPSQLNVARICSKYPEITLNQADVISRFGTALWLYSDSNTTHDGPHYRDELENLRQDPRWCGVERYVQKELCQLEQLEVNRRL